MQKWKVGAHEGGDGHQDEHHLSSPPCVGLYIHQDVPPDTEGVQLQATQTPVQAPPGQTCPAPAVRARWNRQPLHWVWLNRLHYYYPPQTANHNGSNKVTGCCQLSIYCAVCQETSSSLRCLRLTDWLPPLTDGVWGDRGVYVLVGDLPFLGGI